MKNGILAAWGASILVLGGRALGLPPGTLVAAVTPSLGVGVGIVVVVGSVVVIAVVVEAVLSVVGSSVHIIVAASATVEPLLVEKGPPRLGEGEIQFGLLGRLV